MIIGIPPDLARGLLPAPYPSVRPDTTGSGYRPATDDVGTLSWKGGVPKPAGMGDDFRSMAGDL